MEIAGRVDQSLIGWDDPQDEYYYAMPEDVVWHAGRCLQTEVTGFYHRCGVYNALSSETGRISESARLVDRGAHTDPQTKEQAARIRAIVEQFDVTAFRPLYVSTNDVANGPYNVTEGNCRAVALAILTRRGQAPLRDVPVFVATSLSATVRVWEHR